MFPCIRVAAAGRRGLPGIPHRAACRLDVIGLVSCSPEFCESCVHRSPYGTRVAYMNRPRAAIASLHLLTRRPIVQLSPLFGERSCLSPYHRLIWSSSIAAWSLFGVRHAKDASVHAITRVRDPTYTNHACASTTLPSHGQCQTGPPRPHISDRHMKRRNSSPSVRRCVSSGSITAKRLHHHRFVPRPSATAITHW